MKTKTQNNDLGGRTSLINKMNAKAIFLLLSISLIQACSSFYKKEKPVIYKYYITWKNYDYKKKEKSEDVVYIWAGKEVGKGDDGFNVILKKAAEVPIGETVYIFPIPPWTEIGPDQLLGVYPPSFGKYMEEFAQIRHFRKLRTIETNVNQYGEKKSGVGGWGF